MHPDPSGRSSLPLLGAWGHRGALARRAGDALPKVGDRGAAKSCSKPGFLLPVGSCALGVHALQLWMSHSRAKLCPRAAGGDLWGWHCGDSAEEGVGVPRAPRAEGRVVRGWMERGITGRWCRAAQSGHHGFASGCSSAKGQEKGHKGTEQGGDDRRERPAQSRAAADGSLCGTEECLCC